MARWFLGIAAGVFGVVYAVPLLVMPMRWARVFGWRLPEDKSLAIYLGRCLGGVALALCLGALRAALHPAAQPVIFEIIIAAGALMTIVHVVGALERRQPVSETIEIVLYVALTILAVVFYRSL